ncbi:MAG: hypothetical protein AABY15_00865, partial [Nanoarchaeota archaeon]
MLKLIVYGYSEANRRNSQSVTTKRLRNVLSRLNTPFPFLLRRIKGDYSLVETKWIERFLNPNHNYKAIAKPTFDERELLFLLYHILEHGHDRYNEGYWSEYDDEFNFGRHYIMRKCLEKLGFAPKINEVLWAIHYEQVQSMENYSSVDEWAMFSEKRNTLWLILNPELYKKIDSSLFFQSDVQLRRKALQGIIVSEVNPNRSRLPI